MQPDEEQLLAALGEAVRAADDVPHDFVDAGQAAYAWRAIDVELAALSYDSQAGHAVGEQVPAGMRAEPAALRALTFSAGEVTIEVQIAGGRLLGQVATAQGAPARCQVRLELGSGGSMTADADQMGWFTMRPSPYGPFRLRVIMAGQADVLTRWVTI
jgi:hypothetical protein